MSSALAIRAPVPMGEILKHEGFGDRLISGLQYLQEHELLCDLTLVANDNQAVHVHRVVMAASSDYFRALLTLDMKEKNQRVVTLKGVPQRGLRELVRFAYSGQLHCTYDNITEVLLAATHLQFTDAVHLCSKYLISFTALSNCVDMYNIAEQFDLMRLRDKALGIILHHFEDISKREDFVRFHENFLVRVLAENRLQVYSELHLYKLVLKWINHSREDRLKFTHQLMNQVRFPLIHPKDLVEVVMTEPMMKSDPQCLELLLEANKYHMLPDKQPLMQTRRTQVRTSSPCLAMLDIDEEGPRIFDLARRSWGSLHYTHLETYHTQVCVMDNYMYVCGGIELYSSNNPISAKCYRYDPRFDTWSEIASMREPRHHFALVSDGLSIFAIGGYCNGLFKSVVEEYIVREDKWVPRTPIDIRLSAAAAAVYEGRIYVAGGQTDKGISRCLWCFNIASDSWFGRAAMLQGRMDHTMCRHGNQLYVLGGYGKNIIKAFDVNTVEVYDIEKDQWSVIYENAPKISGIYSCLVDHCIYTVGGFTYDENKKRNEVWCYSIKNNEWQVVSRIRSPAMSVPCCALYMPRHMITDITV